MSISPIEVAAGIGIAREVLQLTGDVGRSLFHNLLQNRAPQEVSAPSADVNSLRIGPGSAPQSIAKLADAQRSMSKLLDQFQAELTRVLRAADLPQDSDLHIRMDDRGDLRVTDGGGDTPEVQQAIRQSPLLTDLFRAIHLNATRSGVLDTEARSAELQLLSSSGHTRPLAVE